MVQAEGPYWKSGLAKRHLGQRQGEGGAVACIPTSYIHVWKQLLRTPYFGCLSVTEFKQLLWENVAFLLLRFFFLLYWLILHFRFVIVISLNLLERWINIKINVCVWYNPTFLICKNIGINVELDAANTRGGDIKKDKRRSVTLERLSWYFWKAQRGMDLHERRGLNAMNIVTYTNE